MKYYKINRYDTYLYNADADADAADAYSYIIKYICPLYSTGTYLNKLING